MVDFYHRKFAMITIRFTTFFHGLWAIISMPINFLVLFGPYFLIDTKFPRISSNTGPIIVSIILGITSWVVWNFVILREYPHYVCSYFYIRVFLWTKVTFKEAKKIAVLFEADSNGKWYSMNNVRRMPKIERKTFLLEFAESPSAYYEREREAARKRGNPEDSKRYKEYWAKKEKETQGRKQAYQRNESEYKSNHNDKYQSYSQTKADSSEQKQPPPIRPQYDPILWDKYLRTLNLSGEVSKAKVKEAYYSEIKKYHPDKFEHLDDEFKAIANNKAKEINLAFEYLNKYIIN